MDFVVLDTDVASNIHKDRLSGPMAGRLIGKTLVVTFVTIGELTQWVELRRWGASRRAELDSWLGWWSWDTNHGLPGPGASCRPLRSAEAVHGQRTTCGSLPAVSLTASH